MCGILAWYSRTTKVPITPSLFMAMLTQLKERGPDDCTVFHTKNTVLGHTRLSIIDLQTGTQPLFNENKSVACILNGEIYNFQALREELQKKGHRFRTRSDTEVIVHLYEEKGEQVFQYLDGMFATVIYDMRKNVLLIGRDRMGEKPLIYYDSPDLFLCASELKALLQCSDLPRELNHDAVAAYLNSLYVPSPATIFKNFYKLQPAHYLYVTEHGTTLHKYWSPDTRPHYELEEPDLLEEIRRRFSESTRRRMVADVPLGAFLSGGIDSSGVVAAMARQSSSKVKTFSVAFGNLINELPYAKVVADLYDTDHHEIHIDTKITDLVDCAIPYYDEPFADSSSVPTYVMAKEARKHVKVVLTGDGGDELFAGYDAYLSQKYFTGSRTLSRCLRAIDKVGGAVAGRAIVDMTYPYHCHQGAVRHWAAIRGMFSEGEIRCLCRFPWTGEKGWSGDEQWLEFTSNDPLSTAFAFDWNIYLPDDLLKKVDMASMAQGLECRAPYLDHHLAELSLRIPPEWKLKHNQTKYLLKKAFAGWLPNDILYREKQGFGAPIAAWIRTDLGDLIYSVLAAGCRIDSLFVRREVEAIIHDAMTSGKDWRACHKLWALLVLELWMRKYA